MLMEGSPVVRPGKRVVQPTVGREDSMPKQGDVHVMRNNNGGWQVKAEGSTRARSTHKTQTEAANAGRDIARKNKSELLVHGRDGKIRERSTFGHDPRRTKG